MTDIFFDNNILVLLFIILILLFLILLHFCIFYCYKKYYPIKSKHPIIIGEIDPSDGSPNSSCQSDQNPLIPPYQTKQTSVPVPIAKPRVSCKLRFATMIEIIFASYSQGN